MKTDPYDQADHSIRLAWGRTEAARAAARGDVLVVVDVLSFSTAAALAVERGVTIVPCRPGDGAELASWGEAELAVKREQVPEHGRYSLSPGTWAEAPAGARVVLPSPNGAFCTTLATSAKRVLVGALVNAAAVVELVQTELIAGQAVTVLACGERWREPAGSVHDGPLRVALEDALGAGAILARLTGDLSPEAEFAAAGFRAAEATLADRLWASASGLELRQRGFPDDVRAAAALDSCSAVPELLDGVLEPASRA